MLNIQQRWSGNTHVPRRADAVVEQLHQEYGARLSTSLLALEIGLNQDDYNADNAMMEVREITRTVHLMDANHRLILHYIQRLSTKRHEEAIRCYRDYILYRLIPEGNVDWVEKSIITFIDLSAQGGCCDSLEAITALSKELDNFQQAFTSGLTSVAAQAAHVLI